MPLGGGEIPTLCGDGARKVVERGILRVLLQRRDGRSLCAGNVIALQA